jgi:hypothetical protein
MKLNSLRKATALLILILISLSSSAQKKGWINLFNGKNLKDWTVKIAKHEVGENYANTFRVEDGLMKVRYDGYTDFDKQYGHIFYKKPYSYYIIRVEYRFVGDQAKGGEGWATRNSGVMMHGQDPKTMLKDQDFPISIEGQLLGGDGTHERTTSNVCTPGTTIYLDDKLTMAHCLNSKSKTFHGEQWVTADFVVLGDSVITHYVNKEKVLTYTKPQIGGGSVMNYDPKQKQDGKMLTGGSISLQSESHPVDFRKVELFDLTPYIKDKTRLAKVIEAQLK